MPYASAADVLLVVASFESELCLVEVGSHETGVGVVRQHDHGGDAVHAVTFTDVELPASSVLAVGDEARAILDAALNAATVAASAFAVGGARRALELAAEHATTRHQFGRPIGSFQAVAHRCVDVLNDVEAMELLCHRAAWVIDQGGDATYETSALKAYATDAVRRVYSNAHQVLGAIGYSMEHELQLHSRRGKSFELSWGGASFHRRRVAAAMGLS